MPDSTLGRQALDATEKLLGGWAEAPYTLERRESSLKITPKAPETFGITLYDEGEQCMIAAQRWHTHYDDPAQAAFCALWLLTPYYRLVEEFKGGLMVATWIERYEASGWVGMEPAYFLNPEYAPDWQAGPEEQYTLRIIQQGLLGSPEPYEEIVKGVTLDEAGLPPGSHLGISTVENSQAVGPTLF